MARYIDADKIFYRERMTWSCNTRAYTENLAFKQDIDNVPTEDVAPVVHAHWITNKHAVLDFCSNCGEAVTRYITAEQMDKSNYEGATYWNYCPHCNAIMDEKEEKANK